VTPAPVKVMVLLVLTVAPMVNNPLAVKETVPVSSVTAPLVVIAPVLLTLILPPPVSEMPVMVNGAAVSVNATLPLEVFVALKLLTVLFALSVVPPTDVVVNVPVDKMPAPLIVPPADNVIPVAVVMLCAIEILLLAPVVVALKLLNGVVPPIVPKLNAPAPELSERLLVPDELLSVVPIVNAPPVDAKLLLPVTVTVPKSIALSVVLTVASKVVVLAVLVTPFVKLNVPPLPNVTPAVLLNVVAVVIVLDAPSKTTA